MGDFARSSLCPITHLSGINGRGKARQSSYHAYCRAALIGPTRPDPCQTPARPRRRLATRLTTSGQRRPPAGQRANGTARGNRGCYLRPPASNPPPADAVPADVAPRSTSQAAAARIGNRAALIRCWRPYTPYSAVANASSHNGSKLASDRPPSGKCTYAMPTARAQPATDGGLPWGHRWLSGQRCVLEVA